MATHGYEQNVKFGLSDLQLDAVSNKCNIVLFGHTHTPLSLYKDGIYYFNPGALKDAVCSPGGSTICGIQALEQHGFRGAAMDCVMATYRRNKELGK